MSSVEKSIDVNVPVRTAYNQWTQFEEFPRFMQGVEEVRQIDDKRLHWRAQIAGKSEEWDAEIVEQTPDQRVAWRSTAGAGNSGIVTFEALDADQTRVTVHMEYNPANLIERVGDALGVVSSRVEGDLQRFKEFIESRGSETGAWRGEIHGGQVEHETAAGAVGAAGTIGAQADRVIPGMANETSYGTASGSTTSRSGLSSGMPTDQDLTGGTTAVGAGPLERSPRGTTSDQDFEAASDIGISTSQQQDVRGAPGSAAGTTAAEDLSNRAGAGGVRLTDISGGAVQDEDLGQTTSAAGGTTTDRSLTGGTGVSGGATGERDIGGSVPQNRAHRTLRGDSTGADRGDRLSSLSTGTARSDLGGGGSSGTTDLGAATTGQDAAGSPTGRDLTTGMVNDQDVGATVDRDLAGPTQGDRGATVDTDYGTATERDVDDTTDRSRIGGDLADRDLADERTRGSPGASTTGTDIGRSST